jgi:hypothetical protein
LANN